MNTAQSTFATRRKALDAQSPLAEPSSRSRRWRGRPSGAVAVRAISVLVSGCCVAAAGPCQAQRLALPVDLHQGLAFSGSAPVPYEFSASVAPGIELTPFQFNAVIAPSYVDARWDVALGGGASGLWPFFLSDLGLRLGIVAVYLPRGHAARVALGVGADVLGLLRIMLWPGYDFESRRAYLTTSIGADVVNVVRALSGPKPTDFPPEPP